MNFQSEMTKNQLRETASEKKKQQAIDDSSKEHIGAGAEDGAEFYVDLDNFASSSDYFKSLFRNVCHRHLFITRISSETFKLRIRSIESNSVISNFKIITDLLKAFDSLESVEIAKKILLIFPEFICKENCLQLYSAAFNLHYLDVFKIINLYMQIHFQMIVDNANINIGDLPFKHFERLLQDNYLNINNEEKVWDAIVKWVETDKESRFETVPLLLRCMRLDQCKVSLIHKMLRHPLILSNEHCNNIVIKSIFSNRKNGNLHTRFVEGIKDLSLEPLNLGPRQPHRLLCQVSHYQDIYHSWGLTYLTISPACGHTRALSNISSTSFIPKLVLSSCLRIYVFDCFEYFFAFGLMEQSLVEVQPLPKNEAVSFNLVNGRIFASIITCNYSTYASTAVYDPQDNQWYTLNWVCLTPQKIKVNCFEAAALEGTIYNIVSFSIDGCQFTSVANTYNTEENVWSPFELPGDYMFICNKKHIFTLASYERSLYFTWSSNKLVFRFDPRENGWMPFQELPHEFTHPRVVVYDSNLIVFNQPKLTDPVPPVLWDDNLRQWGSFTWRSACKTLSTNSNRRLRHTRGRLKKPKRSLP